MEFVPLVAMATLVKKVVDLVKYLANGDWNAVITQLVAWAVGVGVIFLGANSDWGSVVHIGDRALDSLNNWSLAFVGLALSSVAGFGWDTLKALDGTNSAATPHLIPPTTTTTTT